MLAFGPGDVAWTGTRGSSPKFTLQTMDLTNGNYTTIGTNSVANISALAWDLGTPTPPAAADLSITKSAAPSSPDNWGDTVVYTLTVSNGGPTAATGVAVTDLLPDGVAYVSDDGGGSYDSGTGIWTIGGLPDAGSATLHITATVQENGSWANEAEVTASDEYDSDSVIGSGEGDTFAAQTLTPFAVPGVDFSASIAVKGQTSSKSKKKTFGVVAMNVGAVPANVSAADFDVLVNGSTNTVNCKAKKSATVKPGKTKSFTCQFSPKTFGITPAQSVVYSVTANIPGDGYPLNDQSQTTVIAK
jgi:uncharacterized repeat protein (TIGR01451 family)